jgi:hypothetical protein
MGFFIAQMVYLTCGWCADAIYDMRMQKIRYADAIFDLRLLYMICGW